MDRHIHIAPPPPISTLNEVKLGNYPKMKLVYQNKGAEIKVHIKHLRFQWIELYNVKYQVNGKKMEKGCDILINNRRKIEEKKTLSELDPLSPWQNFLDPRMGFIVCCCYQRVWSSCAWSLFCDAIIGVHVSNHLIEEEKAGCFTLFFSAAVWLSVLCVSSPWCYVLAVIHFSGFI